MTARNRTYLAMLCAVFAFIGASRARGEQMNFEQSIPTIGRVSVDDGRGKLARNAVLLAGPCWIASRYDARYDAMDLNWRWQCTYWGTSQ